MNQETKTDAWIDMGDLPGTLCGNTEGFTTLRNAIDDLLTSGVTSLSFDANVDGFQRLEIVEDPFAPVETDSGPAEYVMVAGCLTIPILAIFGLIQLIKLIFST